MGQDWLWYNCPFWTYQSWMTHLSASKHGIFSQKILMFLEMSSVRWWFCLDCNVLTCKLPWPHTTVTYIQLFFWPRNILWEDIEFSYKREIWWQILLETLCCQLLMWWKMTYCTILSCLRKKSKYFRSRRHEPCRSRLALAAIKSWNRKSCFGWQIACLGSSV